MWPSDRCVAHCCVGSVGWRVLSPLQNPGLHAALYGVYGWFVAIRCDLLRLQVFLHDRGDGLDESARGVPYS